MSDEHGDDVEVRPANDSWTVSRGALTLRCFKATEDRFEALGRACLWGSEYAEDCGAKAWLLRGDRRTRLTVTNSAELWKPNAR